MSLSRFCPKLEYTYVSNGNTFMGRNEVFLFSIPQVASVPHKVEPC